MDWAWWELMQGPPVQRLTNPVVSRIQAGHRQGLVSPGF